MHKGAQVQGVVIDKILKCEKDGTDLQPRFVTGPAKILCQISLEEPIVLQRYDPLMLRDPDSHSTFGLGKIMKYKPYLTPEKQKEVQQKTHAEY